MATPPTSAHSASTPSEERQAAGAPLLGGDGIRPTGGMAADRTAIDRVDEVAAGESEVIPLVREFATISKRTVETGRVVVHKTTVERDETVEAMLLREDLQVERVPVGRAVTEAPASRREGDVLIVPILEEVLVVEKRLMLKEELHIRTVRSEQAVTETVRLREEQATVDQTGADAPHTGETR